VLQNVKLVKKEKKNVKPVLVLESMPQIVNAQKDTSLMKLVLVLNVLQNVNLVKKINTTVLFVMKIEFKTQINVTVQLNSSKRTTDVTHVLINVKNVVTTIMNVTIVLMNLEDQPKLVTVNQVSSIKVKKKNVHLVLSNV